MLKKIYLLIFLLLVGLALLSLPVTTGNSNSKARVISESTSVISRILFRIQGCNIIHELKDATAMQCPPGIIKKYGLRNDRIFQIIDSQTNIQLKADQVWENYGYRGKGIVIAVLDTGVDYNHPDLTSSIKEGMSFVSYTPYYLDDNGHGTHVTGIITSDGINPESIGLSPEAEVWMAKVCDSEGNCWESDIASAIEFIVDHEVSSILSLSLGGGGTSGPNCNKDYLAKKVNWASENGVIVVAAAGNDGNKVASPACASEAIAVGVVDSNDYIASFSGRGKALDIVAPGIAIISTESGGVYGMKSGTSMAAPVISASIALVLEKNISSTSENIIDSIYNTAEDIGYSEREQGNGRINVLKAFEYDPSGSFDESINCPKGWSKRGLC